MARHKDCNWKLPEGTRNSDNSTSHRWDSVHTAVLMDIRDELKSLNALLHCSNFMDIPNILRGIRIKLPARRKRARN